MAYNFSLIKSPDSQVLVASDSAFLPSEPPDIRNWFSSYEPEYTELNSEANIEVFCSLRGNNFKNDGDDGETWKQEKKVDLVEARTIRKKNELVGHGSVTSNELWKCKNSGRTENNNSASQVLVASESASLPSEPPDIGNWFPSYKYDSLELNSEAFPEVYGSSRENYCEKDGNDVEEKKQEMEGNNLVQAQTLGERDGFVVDGSVPSKGLLKCKNSVGTEINNSKIQGLDSSDSLFLSSEYDLINWFPSYKHQSPVLGSSEEDFGLSDIEEGKADVYERQHLSKGDQGHVWNKNLSVLDDFPSKIVSKENVHSKVLVNNDVSSSKKTKTQIQYDENSTEKLKRKSLEIITSSPSPKTSSITNNGSSPRADEFTEKTSQDDNKMNMNSLGKIHANTELTVDGFISTKKNKSRLLLYDENCFRGPVRVLSKSLKDGVVERKVLSERMNFQHNDVLGVTGKWRCPQKSKPNLGPPLKQLRLEQWVRRV